MLGPYLPSHDEAPLAPAMGHMQGRVRGFAVLWMRLVDYGQTLTVFVSRSRIDLSPSTSYQRLLVHRCSAYYKLAPEADPVTKNIFVCWRAESRMCVFDVLLRTNVCLIHSPQPGATYLRTCSCGGVHTARIPNHAPRRPSIARSAMVSAGIHCWGRRGHIRRRCLGGR